LAGVACALVLWGCGSSSSSPASQPDAGGVSSGDSSIVADVSSESPAPAADASHESASPSDTGSPLDSSGTIPTCPAGQRPFLLRNQCPQSVQVALTAGASGSNCTNGACPPGGQCNTSNNICYWTLPDLGPSHGDLASGAALTVCFEAPQSAQATTQWSGNLAARTGCDASGQNCPPQPMTLAEFTLANQSTANPGTDFYDVSVINGVGVSMEMVAVAGTFAAQSGDPYSCGGPGASTSSNTLGACSWTVQPTVGGTDETTWARAVAPGGPACTSDSDCTGGMLCGLAQSGATFARTCGTPLGWWTADQICGVDPSFGAPYDCASTVQNSDGTTSTYTQLFECAGPDQSQSCYSTGATKDCCGCGTDSASWPKVIGPGFGCKNDNPNWQSAAEPWLAFLKEACPTAYVYPFDDATSTFTCAPASSATPVAYEVTFCP
jgi:Thaumatin family